MTDAMIIPDSECPRCGEPLYRWNKPYSGTVCCNGLHGCQTVFYTDSLQPVLEDDRRRMTPRKGQTREHN